MPGYRPAPPWGRSAYNVTVPQLSCFPSSHNSRLLHIYLKFLGIVEVNLQLLQGSGMMSRVFISYRRADSAAWANDLNRHLGMRYGEDLIFQDVEDIQPGDNWFETIR